MINITPTFHHEYDNTYRGLPENFNTNLSVPRVYRSGDPPRYCHTSKTAITTNRKTYIGLFSTLKRP